MLRRVALVRIDVLDELSSSFIRVSRIGDEVTSGWRKLHNEELHDLYSSPSIIGIIKSRRMGLAGHVARMGEKSNVYRLLIRKQEGKRPQGRPRSRWINNIKMELLE
jgi:hypothetical protein